MKNLQFAGFAVVPATCDAQFGIWCLVPWRTLPHGISFDARAQVDGDLVFLAVALWMPEPGLALSVRANVVDDCILHVGTDTCGDVIKANGVANPPGDVVIRT